MIVQIYEIQTPEQAEQMIELGVDHIGSVILAARQWQRQDVKTTVKTVQAAGRKSSLIPLFTDTDLIARSIDYYRPDIIHFCDMLPIKDYPNGSLASVVARQAAIRQHFPQLEMMRSIPIVRKGSTFEIPSLRLAAAFEPLSDWFLTDTLLTFANACSDQAQPVSGYVGITGQTCDWTLARQLVQQSRIPVILAGGIGPLNVRTGIRQVRPCGVDSCTQTNADDPSGRTIRFQKDIKKVQALVAAARQAARELDAHDRSHAN